MKKILIIGSNSFAGSNFIDFLSLLQSFHSYYERVESNINYDIIWTAMKLYYIKNFPENQDVITKFRVIEGNLLITNSPLYDIQFMNSSIIEIYPKTVRKVNFYIIK